MKKITSILALALALSALSCTKEGPMTIHEITDHYTAPTDATVMTLSKAESTWSTDRRYFDLSFGNDFVTTLVSYDALLTPGEYVIGGDEIGNALAANTQVNGASVQSGYVLVNERDGQYQISVKAGEKVLYWSGTLPFTPDPAATQLSEVMSAQSNLGNGTPSVTMNLATPGISQGYDENWQQVWTGEGGYLALDLYSEDGYLHDGTYTASAEGGVINPGEFGIGWDPGDLYGIGWVFENWGTCWWTVKDGAATAEKITEGLVTVTSREEKVDDKDVTIWTIFWGKDYPQEILFEGTIPALTKPKKPEGPVNPKYLYTDTVTPGDAVDTHAITITDKEGNELAYLELLTAPGETDLTGAYPSTSYASEPGQMRDGYYIDAGEWGVFSGGSYYVEGGEKKYIAAGTATVAVTKLAESAYQFTCEFFDYDAAGPDFVPISGDDDDVTGDVVLKLTSGLTYTMEDVTAGNTDSNQNPLSGVTLWRVTVTDGAGTVASFDLGTAAGSDDLAGEYTVMSYPDAPGKAGNGWGFAAWGMFGGCYFVVDGAHYFIPEAATVNVSNNADGTLKIKFEGPVQKDDYSDGGQGGLLLNNIAKS